MDLSSLTDSQRQQIQQLHQQFQEHQIQRQKEQQESAAAAAAASYDPSHHFQSHNQSIQSYDQSYYPYSHYPQQQQQQQHYPYHQHDYSNAYYQHQSYSQTDPTLIQPPGVSSEAAAAAAASQNAYYPPHTQPIDNPSASSDYPGLNPAAAAAVGALSQLTQFAGNMDAAERAAMAAGMQDRQWNPNNELGVRGGGGAYRQMPMPLHHGAYPVHFEAGRTPYNRGGRSFRGSGRGNFGNRHSRLDGSAPYSRGRGRGGKGVGGRRFLSQRNSSSQFPEASAQKSDSAPTDVEVTQSGKTGTDEPPQTTPASATSTAATTTASGQATKSTRRPPGISWCELCRVDCTTSDILVLHKNGKKHKKNLLRIEVMQNSRNHTSNPTPSRDLPGIQTEKITMGEQEATAHPENIQQNESVTQPALNDLATETITADEQQNKVVELAEVPGVDENEGTTKGKKVDQFDRRKCGLKRKLRGGQDGKRMRMPGHKISRVREPPKEVSPVVCDLCNVKCDTQAVMDIHLVGKKHLSKMNRFQGHQAMYGPVGLQALYPSNPNTQSVFPRQ